MEAIAEKNKYWKYLSDTLNPATALLIYFAYDTFMSYPPMSAFIRIGILILLVVGPIFGYIHIKVKRGSFTNHDVSDRLQRKQLYIFSLIAVMAFMATDYWYIQSFDLSILIGIGLLIALQFSNFFIKSSMHTAFNVLAVYLWFPHSKGMAAVWLFISVLVAYSRFILKRHSLKEILSGATIASLLGILYIYLKNYTL